MTMPDIARDLNEALDLLRQARALVAEHEATPMNLRRAGGSLDSSTAELITALEALQVLAGETELPSEFPNGTPVPQIMSPRQIVYLYKLTRSGPTQGGICQGLKKDGTPCGAKALRYGQEGRCNTHASDADRERNRALREAELVVLQDMDLASMGPR